MPPTTKTNSLHFFHGEDTYSISKKIQFWVEQFKVKYDESSIEILEGKNLELKEFATNLNSMPFLSDKRLIIVKGFLEAASADTQKEMAEILDNEIPDFCILVFTETTPPDKRTTLYKKLATKANAEEFLPPTPAELTNWILDETTKRGGTIDRKTADFLGQHVGPNLWQLSNELDKLISASPNQDTAQTNAPAKSTPITQKLILDLVVPSLSSSIFKLTDAIAALDRPTSLNVFATLVSSGEELPMIFYMIVRHFRILIQTKYLIDQGTDPRSIASELKIHPFVAQNTSKQSKNFDMEKLKKIYTSLLHIDTGFKTGRIKITSEDNRELLLEIERFIIEICK